MADEVTIVNQALGFLGVDRITSLNDNSKSARLAKTVYAGLRDAVLEEGDWRFAIKRFKLLLSAEQPEFGSGNYFVIPMEVLRVIECNENRYDWDVEGNNILIEAEEARILTVSRVVNVDHMSSMFQQAFAARIAWDLALPITQSKTMHDTMFQLYKDKVDYAKANNGMQGSTKRFAKGRLVGSRTSGAFLGGRTNVMGPTV